mmetsp:Transcript_25641/g.75822  ORF Transcript_25641/g.75822 Transcript_25641/m.75822 type:complete len:155 (+) Transcript_25641:428-892(+)
MHRRPAGTAITLNNRPIARQAINDDNEGIRLEEIARVNLYMGSWTVSTALAFGFAITGVAKDFDELLLHAEKYMLARMVEGMPASHILAPQPRHASSCSSCSKGHYWLPHQRAVSVLACSACICYGRSVGWPDEPCSNLRFMAGWRAILDASYW